jgi:D-ribulokinase
MTDEALYLGIDFGTSGARAIAVNPDRQIQFETALSFPAHTLDWQTTLFQLFDRIPPEIRQQTQAITIRLVGK